MRSLCWLVVIALTCTPARADSKTLIEWGFDQAAELRQWAHPNHVADLRIENGALCGRIMDWDPFVRGPQFEINATPYQRVELRLKTDCGGSGQLFWTNTTQSPYGGFSPGKNTTFDVIGDGQWHVYRIEPYWHTEQKIILLRLDFPRPEDAHKGKRSFALDYLRIVEWDRPREETGRDDWDFAAGAHGWRAQNGAAIQPTADGLQVTSDGQQPAAIVSAPLRCPIGNNSWFHVRMKVDEGSAGYIRWVSSKHAGLQSARFAIIPDGQFHNYNLDLSDRESWSAEALLLGLQPSNTAAARAVVRRVACGDAPQGGAEVACSYFGFEDAINRAGRTATLLLNLVNRGGTATRAGEVRIDTLDLPETITVADERSWRALPPLEPFEPAVHRIRVRLAKAGRGQAELRLDGTGTATRPVKATLDVRQQLTVAPMDYVPVPQPAESEYEIGAFYFPGWPSMARWEPVRTHAPERKPVLGWYDEGNPECVDWQIKWAVEHGIKFFLDEWYWSAGNRQLEHWLEAYQRARYRGYLKWAMMWANHNRPGSHSEEDMRNVAQFWVDHYFDMPEYLQLDGKPAVMIWSPENIRRDLGGEDGGRRALEIARDVARQAGYEGIYFIAMKWPEASTDPALIRRLADDGYDMTSIYHYMHHGGAAEDPRHFPFQLVVDSSYEHWKSWHAAGILPFLPNLSTGWDSRPWHGDRATVIHGRSVKLFRQICENAKRFADETGVKRLVLGPVNEWGEGSYVEPNKEFGFGMYEALRDVFCKKPAGGWPVNLAPVDVGLGPYGFGDVNSKSMHTGR